ncbi:MAG: carboxypeptidase regulatory-like domain-containing protein [Natrialbaceae archaeon]|nr:carboxypeptidase regulatory-like domain-containing protein [Natrialbaceae archaeon]
MADSAGQPLAGATVTIDGTGQNATTNATGAYSLSSVAPDSYNLTATAAGYGTDTTSNVTVNPGQSVTDVNFTLIEQNGSISGTVSDGLGQALSGATVSIDSTGQSASTDASGSYTISNVSAGTYNLTASLANYTSDSVTNVSVSAGEAVTDVNFTLTAQVVDVSLSLANASLEVGDTTQATVNATWANGTTQEVTSSATLASNNASVATVNGSGVVTAQAQGQTNISATYAGITDETPVTVTDGPAPLPASYYGSITIDGQPAPANLTVEAEINGSVRGSINTSSPGAYGGPGVGDPTLDVPGTTRRYERHGDVLRRRCWLRPNAGSRDSPVAVRDHPAGQSDADHPTGDDHGYGHGHERIGDRERDSDDRVHGDEYDDECHGGLHPHGDIRDVHGDGRRGRLRCVVG